MNTPLNITIQRLKWYAKATRAYYQARFLGLPGHEFFRFGRKLGWELYRHDPRRAWDLLVNPVSSTRYFEFSFARKCLPPNPGSCLDVSSPILFGLYVARKFQPARLSVINPDITDMSRTHAYLQHLKLPPIHTENTGVSNMPGCPGGFDVIWALSVVEHIQSEHEDDSSAVRAMFAALRPGGRLILTVPTEKTFQIEYREKDMYGLQSPKNEQIKEKFFFQRVYDEQSIENRLIRPLNMSPTRIEWFGEKTPGHFNEYIRRWTDYGRNTTVWDPLEMARHYRLYKSWSDMPGAGVCGLMFTKP